MHNKLNFSNYELCRPKPGQRQDDQHGHQQRDEGGLLWCNLAT
eukprot:SAG31_NODE_309_length_17949_cov_11.083361_9_plen_43_part_00